MEHEQIGYLPSDHDSSAASAAAAEGRVKSVRPGQLAVFVDPKGGGQIKPPEQQEGEGEATDPVAAALQAEEEKATALKGTLHVGGSKNVLVGGRPSGEC